ncbi:MAG TPA: universal stress protein [Solirubrobacterales bacterium]|nr:universal stress protein [Solirubrobacterales bacterium]
MYRRILVGYDGQEPARDALTLGRALAAIEGAELVLAAALENLDPLATPADAYERATAEADDRLTASAQELLGPERDFRLRMVGGVSAPRALTEIAEDERAEVVVIGSTHRGGIGRVLPGSVGERLLQGAPCAVLVAPRGFAQRSEPFEIRSVGVGYDGRTESTHARDVAAVLASELGATLATITVGPDEGDPGYVLAERSGDFDLLVVGSRGYGPVRHALEGNVSGKVMREAASPVLVVPRSA